MNIFISHSCSDPSLHRPTHFLQQPGMGNQAGGVKDRHPSDGGGRGGGEGGGQESKRIEEMVAPLCTARLRPTRQKTKNAVANITGLYILDLDKKNFFACLIL